MWAIWDEMSPDNNNLCGVCKLHSALLLSGYAARIASSIAIDSNQW